MAAVERRIEPEDYQDSCCGGDNGVCGCGNPAHHHHHPEPENAIPVRSILEECDRLFNQEKMEELGDYLRQWREKAQIAGDKRGELTILSELMGHYRMTDDPARGMPAILDGLALIDELDIGTAVSAGTILLNAATALKAFGYHEEALTHYKKVEQIYTANLNPADWLFAGLYNNMAAAYMDAGDFELAESSYGKALDVLKTCGNLMDSAVTCVNLAQLYHQQNIEDPRIERCLDRAMSFFNDPKAERDGYYAHTCRKCAPAFGYLGFFLDEEDLNARADAIYARN